MNGIVLVFPSKSKELFCWYALIITCLSCYVLPWPSWLGNTPIAQYQWNLKILINKKFYGTYEFQTFWTNWSTQIFILTSKTKNILLNHTSFYTRILIWYHVNLKMLQWFPSAYDTVAAWNTVVRKLILCSTSTAT